MKIIWGEPAKFGCVTGVARQISYQMRRDQMRKYPRETKQGFDFFQNLGVY